jgi:hypothetical protein
VIESDARQLAAAIRSDFPVEVLPSDAIWQSTPALRVIDCVLSLRKKYDTVVLPRVRTFGERFPEIESCADLRAMIDRYPDPLSFLNETLTMNSPGKADALVGVLDYMIDIQQRFPGETEPTRLGEWARWARPGDFLTVGVRGFALAGFQYLRMLFGAETVKPDVHILAYAERVLRRRIAGNASAEVGAVYVYERAGELLGRSARQIDIAIWERESGRASPTRNPG